MTAVAIRPAWAEIDLDAVAANVRLLTELVAPAAVCAVVKADGYGHGAIEVARAAVEAGATWLAVALPGEGRLLRDAGLAAPILLLSEPETWDETLDVGLTPTVYSERGIAVLAEQVSPPGGLGVHLKVDTGMHRVGAHPADALARARQVTASGLRLDAVWTHCPVADEPEHPFTPAQCERFDRVLTEIREAGIDVPMAHAANSAGAIAHPALRHDMVRCGIAIYGLDPSPLLRGAAPLQPVMSLRSRVSHVQVVAAGEAVSYGLRRPAPTDIVVATVPLGYADGLQRRWGEVDGVVLVGGRRRPLAGTVTMDQILVDCGPADAVDSQVAVGDEVVLIGRQGDEELTAAEWAERLGTISYEIVCGIGPRIPRVHRSGRAPGARP